MKLYPKMTLSLIAIFAIAHTCLAKKKSWSESILTAHKWTLVEITQKQNDTLTNLTLFLTPCEKDNLTAYANNGTYQILEGSQKCNAADGDVKGEGTWMFETADSTIVESYEGGKKIPKKILMLNDEVFKIQYYGEGKKELTLTFFSEEGKKDAANQDMIVDNSDPGQNITQIIKDYLGSTNRYVLVSMKDFQNAVKSEEDDNDGLKPTVAVMPFTNDMKEKVNAAKRNTELMAQAKKSDIDYVITGRIIKSEAKKDGNNDYTGSVSYEVFIIEPATGSIIPKTINDTDPDVQPEKKGSLLRKGLDIGSKLALGALSITNQLFWARYGYYGYYYNYNYYNTYNTLFKASKLVSAASETASVFTDVNNTLRDETYNKNNATFQAVNKTTTNVITYVATTAPVKIKITMVEGEGRKSTLIIGAGSNLNLKEGDRLCIYQITNSAAGIRKKEIGEIEIKELIQGKASSCTLEENRDDILKAFKERPDEIVAVPKLKS